MEEKNKINNNNLQEYIDSMKKLGFWGGFRLGVETGYEYSTYLNQDILKKSKSPLENTDKNQPLQNGAQEANPQGPYINNNYNL